MRRRIFLWSVACAAVATPAVAQTSNDTRLLSRMALTVGYAHYQASGMQASGALLIDAASFATVLQTDATTLAADLGTEWRSSDRSAAIICDTGRYRACHVAGDGVFFAVDSALVHGDYATVFVRYRFTGPRIEGRSWTYVPFVQLRVDFVREGLSWRVAGHSVVSRS